jgi:GMP synthase (glutamine-hydrolysing)
MSHGDQLSAPPSDFHVIGRTPTAPFAALAHNSKPFYGIQFHPEVTHSPRGKEVIGRFILNICKCKANWTMVCPLIAHLDNNRSSSNINAKKK